MVKLLALLSNVILAKRNVLWTNALAYFAGTSVTKKKRFVTSPPEQGDGQPGQDLQDDPTAQTRNSG